MNFAHLIARLRAILFSPRATWPEIASEPASIGGLYTGWVLWLAAITPLASFIGLGIFGMSVPFIGSFRIGFGTLFGQLVTTYLLTLLIVFLMALITAALAPSFGARNDRVQALKAIAYAWTPVWIVGVLHLIPLLGALTVLLTLAATAYSVWLLWQGLQATLGAPQERAVAYTAVVVVIAIVLGVVIGWTSAMFTSIGAMGRANIEASVTMPASSGISGLAAGMQQAARQMQATGKAMQGEQAGAAGQAANLAPIKPLAPGQMTALLPASLPGLKRGNVDSTRGGIGALQVSEAKADYGSGAQRIQLGITDMGANRAMLAMIGMVQQDQESASGYHKVFQRDGRTVQEQWTSATRTGEYTLIVGDRFMVQAKGQGPDMAALKQAVDAVDLARLQQLKDTPGE
ncbi:MAG: YIP1 family protein [Proteobacteria bacterium]|nr:YIP1 family protein [Pseudomonadota bacterium]